MTVRELIELLNGVEDKSKSIVLDIYQEDGTYSFFATGITTSPEDDIVYIHD